MAKSRQRKNHKKKVEMRNQRIKKEYEIAAKKAWAKFDEWKKQNNENKHDEGFSGLIGNG